MAVYKTKCNQVGVEVVGTIFQTSDYSICGKVSGNRKVRDNALLKRELKEMGQLSPIEVNSNFEVIDGQHRLAILKELKLPVKFVILESNAPRNVISMNSAQRNWSDADYLNFFVDNGNPEYIRLNQLLNQYKDYVSLNVLYSVVLKSPDKFKSGTLVIKDEFYVKGVLGFLKEFAVRTNYGKMPAVIQTNLVRLYNIKGVSTERFIEKFISLGMVHEKPLLRNRETCFEVFITKIYNDRLKESSPHYIPYRYTKTKTIEIIEK